MPKYFVLLDLFGNLVFFILQEAKTHCFRTFILLNSKTVSFLNGFNDIKKGIFKKYLQNLWKKLFKNDTILYKGKKYFEILFLRGICYGKIGKL